MLFIGVAGHHVHRVQRVPRGLVHQGGLQRILFWYQRQEMP